MDSTLISARRNEETPSLNRARRAALGSFAGAVVDWYDFLLYGITAALVFNREFFPQISPAMGTLAAFATFGVGFLFRPLGGVIFGHFGDRLGRKRCAPFRALPSAVNGAARHCCPWKARRRIRKRFTAAACRWVMAWVCCSPRAWCR